MPRDDALLVDILRAARLGEEFVGGYDKAAFLADLKTQSAVVHQLLVIGEAVKSLSQSFCVDHPEVPWKAVAGMRDVLIHHYNAVDLEEVWKTVVTDVPELITAVEQLLPKQ
jgi:uncharacterized protein with HEPN domain